ncbi:O-antigen polymerase [Massilia niabensis]|uniref:O-antigen polymerase n=1 Tax=Massilia niabensis TaxID=544910 RepID=A0ABW0L6Y1_9BURK
MEIIDKLVAICFSFGILFQAVVVRRLVGTWLFPATLFSLFWFFATIVPLAFLFLVPVSPLAMIYIFCACILFSCTALPFHWRAAFLKNSLLGPTENYGSPFMVRSFYLFSAGAVVTLIISIGEQGFSLTDILLNFLAVANQYMAKRYSDELSTSIFSQLSFVLMYPAAIFGGLVFDEAKSGRKKLLYMALVLMPSLLALLVQGAKGNLFLVLAFFWGAILMGKLNKGERTLFREINWVKTSIYLFAVFVMLIMSFLSRGLFEETDNNVIVNGLIRYFASYTSAHLYAFSDWFSYYVGAGSVMNYDLDGEANGFYTFMSAFKLAGSQKETVPGVYGEYFYYGEFITSNIYTWFRGLITDFGLSGAAVFMCVFGAISHLMFFGGLVLKNRVIPHTFFIHFIGFVYTTYIISLLIWNSVYTSFIIVAVVLIVNRWLNGNRHFASLPQPAV